MTLQIPGLEVVAVLRRCSVCSEYKPLEHFLRWYAQSQRPHDDVKVCAACRRKQRGARNNAAMQGRRKQAR